MHRRDVLKLFSLAAISAVAPIEKLGFLNGRVFESKPFGIRLMTPPKWQCLLTADYLDLLDMDYGDKNPKVPILACTRFREPIKFENDTVLVFADRMRERPSESLAGSPRFLPLDVAKTDFQHYFVPATTTEGRALNFERDAYFFNDGSSRFHIEFEWDASKPSRSNSEFKEILGSIELAHEITPGWGQREPLICANRH